MHNHVPEQLSSITSRAIPTVDIACRKTKIGSYSGRNKRSLASFRGLKSEQRRRRTIFEPVVELVSCDTSHHHQGTSYFTSLVSPSSTSSYSAAATHPTPIVMRSSSKHSIQRGIRSTSVSSTTARGSRDGEAFRCMAM